MLVYWKSSGSNGWELLFFNLCEILHSLESEKYTIHNKCNIWRQKSAERFQKYWKRLQFFMLRKLMDSRIIKQSVINEFLFTLLTILVFEGNYGFKYNRSWKKYKKASSTELLFEYPRINLFLWCSGLITTPVCVIFSIEFCSEDTVVHQLIFNCIIIWMANFLNTQYRDTHSIYSMSILFILLISI